MVTPVTFSSSPRVEAAPRFPAWSAHRARLGPRCANQGTCRELSGGPSKAATGPRGWRPLSGPHSRPTCPPTGAKPGHGRVSPRRPRALGESLRRAGRSRARHRRRRWWWGVGGRCSTCTNACTGGCSPAGTSSRGRGPWDAALRESHEETGLAVGPPCRGAAPRPRRRARRGQRAHPPRPALPAPGARPRPAPPPGESPEARWFGWEEAAAVADEALVGALRAARLQPEVGPWAAREPDRLSSGRSARAPVPGTMVPERRDDKVETARHDRREMTTGEDAQEPGSGSPRGSGAAAGPAARCAGPRHRHRPAPPPPGDDARTRRAGRPSTGNWARSRPAPRSCACTRDELGDRQAALEQQIEASRTRREALEKRLFGGQVVAARELQAMNEEVKHLARHITELEDREIEVMEALEPLDGSCRPER